MNSLECNINSSQYGWKVSSSGEEIMPITTTQLNQSNSVVKCNKNIENVTSKIHEAVIQSGKEIMPLPITTTQLNQSNSIVKYNKDIEDATSKKHEIAIHNEGHWSKACRNQDIFQLIFSKCNVQSLRNLALVSKSFNIISCSDEPWNKIALWLFLPPKTDRAITSKKYVENNYNWKLSQSDINCLAFLSSNLSGIFVMMPILFKQTCEKIQANGNLNFPVFQWANAASFLENCMKWVEGGLFQFRKNAEEKAILSPEDAERFQAIISTTMTFKELTESSQALFTRIYRLSVSAFSSFSSEQKKSELNVE